MFTLLTTSKQPDSILKPVSAVPMANSKPFAIATASRNRRGDAHSRLGYLRILVKHWNWAKVKAIHNNSSFTKSFLSKLLI